MFSIPFKTVADMTGITAMQNGIGALNGGFARFGLTMQGVKQSVQLLKAPFDMVLGELGNMAEMFSDDTRGVPAGVKHFEALQEATADWHKELARSVLENETVIELIHGFRSGVKGLTGQIGDLSHALGIAVFGLEDVNDKMTTAQDIAHGVVDVFGAVELIIIDLVSGAKIAFYGLQWAAWAALIAIGEVAKDIADAVRDGADALLGILQDVAEEAAELPVIGDQFDGLADSIQEMRDSLNEGKDEDVKTLEEWRKKQEELEEQILRLDGERSMAAEEALLAIGKSHEETDKALKDEIKLKREGAVLTVGLEASVREARELTIAQLREVLGLHWRLKEQQISSAAELSASWHHLSTMSFAGPLEEVAWAWGQATTQVEFYGETAIHILNRVAAAARESGDAVDDAMGGIIDRIRRSTGEAQSAVEAKAALIAGSVQVVTSRAQASLDALFSGEDLSDNLVTMFGGMVSDLAAMFGNFLIATNTGLALMQSNQFTAALAYGFALLAISAALKAAFGGSRMGGGGGGNATASPAPINRIPENQTKGEQVTIVLMDGIDSDQERERRISRAIWGAARRGELRNLGRLIV